MAVSTTLITFLVRTPSTTRSVDLYGSWDNFALPYRMSRDVRLGREHWSGCHTFENIICDGNVDGRGMSRNGALKMGGTYWYYYKLDDEIEFHNSSEPSTTRCPLLPGQLVNELQVPMVLSGSRKRDASASSTSSERRTLDPEAKFVNPRPVPPLPTLDRLRTSPTLMCASPVAVGSGTHPVPIVELQTDQRAGVASNTPEVCQLPRKLSLDGSLKDASPKKKTAGLRSPFQSPGKTFSVEQSEKYQDIINWIPSNPVKEQQEPAASFDLATVLETHHPRPPRGALLLRSNSEEAVTLASFRAHRRQRSRSQSRNGRSALGQNLVDSDSALPLDLDTGGDVEQGVLSALLEVNTPATPGYGPQTGRRITLEALEGRSAGSSQSEKRLPTLPTTPSSACLKDSPDLSQPRCDFSLGIDQSRFSATTIDSPCHLNSMIIDQNQHSQFLKTFGVTDWSLEPGYPIEQGIGSSDGGQGYVTTAPRIVSSDDVFSSKRMNDKNLESSDTKASTLAYMTVHSASSTTPTTSYGDSDSIDNSHFSYATSTRSSEDSIKNYQHYSLPETDNPSEVTLKQYSTQDRVCSAGRPQASRHTSLSHSEGMQQLLSELSYLSELIQS